MRLLPPLADESMREYSLRVLKQNIISLDMEPGKMYSEKELADQLGLSRTPLREALLQLSKIKIVEIYPQRGSAVALVDYDLVEEARFIRDALECAVLRIVCQTPENELFAQLEGNVRRQQKCLDAGVIEPLMQLDNNFHKLLFTIANKMQSYDFVCSMTIHLDRVRSMALTGGRDFGFVAEHQTIWEAICQRDEEKAVALMRSHLSRFRVDERDLRARYPGYFKETSTRQ